MWKEFGLNAYYCATLAGRRRAAAERARSGAEPVHILFYHRVANNYPNGWTMTARSFARQIEWLRRRFEFVGLGEAQARISSRTNRRPTVCITFDDGYADNRLFAVPLLVRYQIPFTYFVSTKQVLGGAWFPHDLAARQPLAVNNLSDLREMAAAGAEIGAHTRGHVNLGACLSNGELVDEIVGSKHELEAALGREVRYFSFPYGLHKNMTHEAFHVAFAAGYAGVCSAYGGYNFPGDDPFHLRRIHADPEFIRFKNWLSTDPRKVRSQRDFDPGAYRSRFRAGSREAVGA
jgi:peptidoglycan/xylan/chitin deacetylase (PgdA/CDA1 family)